MKSMDSHGSSSLLLVMKVMVWHFVSNSHKVMTALIVMIPFKLGVWFWLRRHIFGKVLADLWYEMHTNVAHIICGQCRLPNPGIFECMKPQRTQVVASDVSSLLCLISEPMSSSKYYQVILLLRLTTCNSHFIGPACKVETREQCNFHLDSCFFSWTSWNISYFDLCWFELAITGTAIAWWATCSHSFIYLHAWVENLDATFPIWTDAGLKLP
jgi:hypothetical protein